MAIDERLKAFFSIRRSRPRDRHASGSMTFFVGLTLAVVGLALFASLFEVWPTVERGRTSAMTEIGASLLFGLYTLKLTQSTGLLLLAALGGALGAYIHTVTSFSTYVGNRAFKSSWIWWYLLRIFAGAALALLLYFAFRGGLITADDASEDVNPYGVAALAGLAGLFSKQAIDKLKEVFDVFFRTPSNEGDATRSDKVQEGQPTITALDPATVKTGDVPELKVVGERFDSQAVIRVEGQVRPTTFVSAQELKTQLKAGDTGAAKTLTITVKNPTGRASAGVELKVET